MKKCLLLSVALFQMLTCYAIEEIGADKYTDGEKALQESVEGNHNIYRLWPGNGARKDDPLKAVKETSEKKGVIRIKNITVPSLMVRKAKKPDGRCVIVFPGGGYGILAAAHEGSEVGVWLNKQGITAIIVKYRCPRRQGIEKHAVALQDAQRAIRLVRSNAKKFGIDPNKIGVMGFSAGGHLSALTIHQSDAPSYPGIDEADKTSCKPDFGILIYPAYLINEKGLDPMVSGVQKYKIPTYIAISVNDRSFVAGAHKYAEHLGDSKIPVDYHLYSQGRHGTGLGGFPWTASCEQWLKDLKL